MPVYWGITDPHTSNTVTAEALSKFLHYSHAHLLPGRSCRMWLLGHAWQGWRSSPCLVTLAALASHSPAAGNSGVQRGMNQQARFKNQSNSPFQGQTQVELHRVFSKRPPEPFCSSLLSPCSSQCTCERNN